MLLLLISPSSIDDASVCGNDILSQKNRNKKNIEIYGFFVHTLCALLLPLSPSFVLFATLIKSSGRIFRF